MVTCTVSFCWWMPAKAQLDVDPPETEDHSIVKRKVTFVKVLFNFASLCTFHQAAFDASSASEQPKLAQCVLPDLERQLHFCASKE